MSKTPQSLMRIKAIEKLSRWKEHIPFGSLVMLGALLANSFYDILVDWRLITVLLANFLAMSFAFMINDIADAEDDAKDKQRALRNPVTSGEISPMSAYLVSILTAVISLILYALSGHYTLIAGSMILLLAVLYSIRPFRLKAIAGLDIVSHSLMLGGLLVLSGYYTYSTIFNFTVWEVALAATFASIYGQIYNQLRDLELDKEAGLYTIALVIGSRYAHYIMYGSVVMAFILILVSLFTGAFPIEVVGAALASIAISTIFRPKTDMRGGQAIEISGSLQIQFWIAANLTLLMWLGMTFLKLK
jgi:1,4-dihydroxy-2-naphthoate octaprenyltransferase